MFVYLFLPGKIFDYEHSIKLCVGKHQNITNTLSTKNTCKYLEGMMILTHLSIYIKAQRKHGPNDIENVNSKFGQTESLV